MNAKQAAIVIMLFVTTLVVISLPLWWDFAAPYFQSAVVSIVHYSTLIWNFASRIFEGTIDPIMNYFEAMTT